MANNPAHYKVYVIRHWEEQNPLTNTVICRFTLELPGTGQRFGFTSSEALLEDVERRLAENLTEPIDQSLGESFDQSCDQA